MDHTYLLLKTLHITGAILFLGNIIITGWWKVMADRTRNPAIVAFAQRQVTLTDFVFTAGGVVLVAIGGIGNAQLHGMDYLHINWMSKVLWLFTISGVLWVAVLIPVQIKQERMAREFAVSGVIPEQYWVLGRIWGVAGTLATITPLAALYWMVYKPA